MKTSRLVLIAFPILLFITVSLFYLTSNPFNKRPQVPAKPYPYYSEEVTFQNTQANIILSGTLTMPAKEGYYPAAILISGSGPQNRNEELLGHKPFLIISDYLTKKGIAVLRYDDRGFGQSSGEFKSATTLDFATDVESAITYLKSRNEINKNQIGLIGHSEGGLIAPMVAAKSKDVDFIVLLAGPGINGSELIILQQELIFRASGIPESEIIEYSTKSIEIFSMITKGKDIQALKNDLANYLEDNWDYIPTFLIPKNINKEEFIAGQIDILSSPWLIYFLNYNPVPALEKVICPVLALNGEKDLQVPPKENLSAIYNALTKGGNQNVTIKELPNLNHLFQECETGSPDEYESIKQTFSPSALEEISDWVINQVK